MTPMFSLNISQSSQHWSLLDFAVVILRERGRKGHDLCEQLWLCPRGILGSNSVLYLHRSSSLLHNVTLKH